VITSESFDPWIESSSGDRINLTTNCSLGRGALNDIVVDSVQASRRHAVIHLQNIGEFWLVDFGSTNGTYLNSRRIAQPVRLCNDDEIMIGELTFKFRQPQKISVGYQTTVTQETLRRTDYVSCWLLLADIENFTPLSRETPVEELAEVLGTWMSACKQIVEESAGSVNKYLGDGILAYWRDGESAAQQVLRSIVAFRELQRSRDPRFRIVIHYGPVVLGGLMSMGEESLLGKDVNFVFRLEKLAGSLKEAITASTAAQNRLGSLVSSRSLGSYEIKGFDGDHELFAVP
jgi:class 3 adenylate cyclase